MDDRAVEDDACRRHRQLPLACERLDLVVSHEQRTGVTPAFQVTIISCQSGV
jgi:hypothetical protein